MNDLLKIYNILLKQYSHQGWWPIIGSGSARGYHPGDYSYPKNSRQRFEICTGALLTQNTAWTNVEKSLLNLKENKLLNAKAINNDNSEKIKDAIRPAGYYNQKTHYLYEFGKFYISLKGRIPSRSELLNVKGIGPETADSILLYAYKQPEFVVDSYTKRFFSHLGLIDEKAEYHEIKEIFQKNLPRDIPVYQEYHALIVEHFKNNYSKKSRVILKKDSNE